MLGEFAKYAFFGLKRKRRNFERSVLKYVSIKIPTLTHSGRKSRFCVNVADRLLPFRQRTKLIAVRLRVKKKVQNLNAMWYKEFAKNFATQGDFGHESP